MILHNFHERTISTFMIKDGMMSVLNADLIRDEQWQISRVNVHGKHRRKGIGSSLVKKAIDLMKESSAQTVIVYPGGYGENIEDQIGFYKKCGFVDGSHPGELIYDLRT